MIEIMTSERVVASAAPITRRPAPGTRIRRPRSDTRLVGKIISMFRMTFRKQTIADRLLGVFMSPVLCIVPLENWRRSINGMPRQ